MAIWQQQLASGVVLTHTTTRDEGDFAVDGAPDELTARRQAVAPHPWVWLRQVHGADVVVVTAGNAAEVAGSEADALVTADPDLVLAIQTADCAPILLWSTSGVIGAVHAGWRGLEAGVLERTMAVMSDLGAGSITHQVGPHIGVECYEFGSHDLDRLAGHFGDRVRGVTSSGSAALDLSEAVRAAMGRPIRPEPRTAGRGPAGTGRCTACAPDRWFSHRARGEQGRMATVIWRESSYERAMASR